MRAFLSLTTSTSSRTTPERRRRESRDAIEPSLSLNWIDLPGASTRTDLARARVNYTFSPRMFFSGLLQYNSTNDTLGTNLRLRWEYSPGSELFVVYTDRLFRY